MSTRTSLDKDHTVIDQPDPEKTEMKIMLVPSAQDRIRFAFGDCGRTKTATCWRRRAIASRVSYDKDASLQVRTLISKG